MVRIAFLCSGQLRKSSLTTDEHSDERVLQSFREHLFNEELRAFCEYDVFMSTDPTLHVAKTQEFFGEHLKNIHMYETGYYLRCFVILIEIQSSFVHPPQLLETIF